MEVTYGAASFSLGVMNEVLLWQMRLLVTGVFF